MSVTRAEDRPDRSHVPPTPPAKLAPADDPAWAHTLALAALAREARQAEESFIAMPIEVSRGSLDDARFALAFFQLNQTERVTAEVDDDHLRVYLDDGWQLAWYLDTDQPEVHVGRRPKWYTLDEWLRTTHNLTDDEEAETVASEITDAMANLAGFLYSAQIGAINALSAKSRP
jgi:hypothetical protein